MKPCEVKFWARLSGGRAARIVGEAGRALRNAGEEAAAGFRYEDGAGCGPAASVWIGAERVINWDVAVHAEQIRHAARLCRDSRISIPAEIVASNIGLAVFRVRFADGAEISVEAVDEKRARRAAFQKRGGQLTAGSIEAVENLWPLTRISLTQIREQMEEVANGTHTAVCSNASR